MAVVTPSGEGEILAMGRDSRERLKQTIKGAGLLLTLVLIGACSSGSERGSSDEVLGSTYSVSGSIGDGPIVGADIEVRDANGEVVATGTSDDQAAYAIDIPTNAALPVTVHVTGGTDLVTNRAADFELVAMVNATGLQTVNVSPLTSFAVKAAECRGTPTVNGLNDSWDDITRELNIGLDTVQLGDPMTQTIDGNNVETAVLANESLGELVRRTGAAFGGAIPLDLIVDVLACDIADGALDGSVVGSTGQDEPRIFAVAKSAEIAIRLEVIAGALEVDGVDATEAMNNSIRTIMPEETGADVNTVPVTQASIDGAIQAIDALADVLPDGELDTLRATLESANPTNVSDRVEAELDSSTQSTLQGLPDRVAVLDETEIDEIGDAGGNGGGSNGDSGGTGGDSGGSNGNDEGSDDNSGGSGGDSGDSGSGGGSDNLPTVQLSVSNANPAMGASVTISWSSTGASSCQASGGWNGNQALSGQQATGSVTGPVTYTLTCSNGDGSSVAMVSVAPIGSLTVSWQAPTENVDGTPVSALTSYRIHYGTSSGQYDSVAQVEGAVSSHTLSLPVGTYYIAMTVTDAEGDESGLSNEVTLTAQ
ncbi:MAG: hypothetical protein GKR90_15030 [Pseudomonadales bacterium]|nr:hypothetical protein [Pseudomonadales bacterium]